VVVVLAVPWRSSGLSFKHLRFLRLLPGPPRTFHAGALRRVADHTLAATASVIFFCWSRLVCGGLVSDKAAEEVANSPRNQHRTRPYGWVTKTAPNEQVRERRPGVGVERKNLETQGITKVSLTLKVTAVVLRRPQVPRPTESQKSDLWSQ
jgi:hypothetical protein